MASGTSPIIADLVGDLPDEVRSRDGSKTRESRRYLTEYCSEYFYTAALSILPLETAAGVSNRF
jgi:hypothetical protein